MTSVGEKKPFHEVLMGMLVSVGEAGGITVSTPESFAKIATILDALSQSKMPAAAAHKIAEDYGYIFAVLADFGHPDLARPATETLADLRNRKD